MNLSHYTNEPLGPIRNIAQPVKQERWGSPYKPQGLWLSVDGEDDWKAWCEAESFGLGKRRYKVILKPHATVLYIRTASELLRFTEQYDKRLSMGGQDFSGHYIDWIHVAKEYGGMVIAPYQWPLRLDHRTHWYYGWDCASGCIWNAAEIERVVEMTEPEGLTG